MANLPQLKDDGSLAFPLEESPKKKLNMRQQVEEVFTQLGGSDAMLQWVNESTVNRRIFYKDIVPKLINRETSLTGDGGGPLQMEMIHGINLKGLSDKELETWINLVRKTSAIDIECSVIEDSDE